MLVVARRGERPIDMRLPFWTKKPEARSSVTTSTALVVIELPADGLPSEESTADLQDEARRRWQGRQIGSRQASPA